MTYELIQAALTNLITFTAIAGLSGIILRDFYTSHRRWMQTYCPPVAPAAASNPPTDTVNLSLKYFEVGKVETGEAIAPIAPSREPQPAEFENIWEAPINTSSPRYWVRPTQPQQPTVYLLPAAKEEVKPATKKTRKTPAKPRATRSRKAA
jgi:hypothetical protein